MSQLMWLHPCFNSTIRRQLKQRCHSSICAKWRTSWTITSFGQSPAWAAPLQIVQTTSYAQPDQKPPKLSGYTGCNELCEKVHMVCWPCSHNYCKQCLEQLFDQVADNICTKSLLFNRAFLNVSTLVRLCGNPVRVRQHTFRHLAGRTLG